MVMKKRILSGMRPTGKLHIGHYVGALENWVKLQEEYESYHLIADYHVLTTNLSTDEIYNNSIEMVIDWLASGLDHLKSPIFRQSQIKEHAELFLIYSMLITTARLERNPTVKEQVRDLNIENVIYGHLGYPVLQAADILLYKGEVVPVGEDQLQHLELSCKLARKFNHRYGQFFAEIQPILSPTPRLMSLNNPEKKMSKSLGEKSYVAIRDSKDIVSQKIKKAVADKKGVENLLTLYSYFGQNKKYQQMKTDFKAGKLMNANLKDELTKVILGFLEPLQKKIATYQKNPQTVNKIITQGNQQAQKIADQNLTEIKKIVGLR